MKYCPACKETLEVTKFSKAAIRRGGYQGFCKNCYNTKTLSYRRSRLDNGICRDCSLPKLKNSAHCLFHWALSSYRTNSRQKNLQLSTEQLKQDTKSLLGKLANQKFRCAYSGICLIPGINASLEHVNAFTNNKDGSIANIVWVDSLLNKLKGSKDKESAEQKFSYYIKAIQTNEYPIYRDTL